MKSILAVIFFFCLSTEVLAEVDFSTMIPEQIPSHVQSIEKENTATQTNRDLVTVEAEELTKKWLDNVNLSITNPYLIEQLNKTEVNQSIFAFGYSSEVYLGRWPLSYQTAESSVNWAYQKINVNFVAPGKPTYVQGEDRLISGGIQNKVSHSEQVQNMILANPKERIHWPIDYEANFDANTKKVSSLGNESGADQLQTYAAAVKEIGKITYGEVYLTMTGKKQKLKIKNIVEEELTTWLPVQNHLAFHLK